MPEKTVQAIAFVKNTQVLLGLYKSAELVLFDIETGTQTALIKIPSKSVFPNRI